MWMGVLLTPCNLTVAETNILITVKRVRFYLSRFILAVHLDQQVLHNRPSRAIGDPQLCSVCPGCLVCV